MEIHVNISFMSIFSFVVTIFIIYIYFSHIEALWRPDARGRAGVIYYLITSQN